MFCPDNSKRMNIQTRCQLFAENNDPLHLLHYYRKGKEKFGKIHKILIYLGRNQFKHAQFSRLTVVSHRA